ncbi:mucoidy inhibitor MuiA family protein [uncultured Thiothrix sp.]|uniref:mucoidy inhibitor MuiA family protein n=1 Tax=uncultured Thiothrix sp. TaxID=223185 RepID=UPI002610CDBA|nr:mucoidy inhibitor MuiA family protein [uncultured Thiothrix sp.]
MRISSVIISSLSVTLFLPQTTYADLQANSNISAVTIYPDSARITRMVTLDLAAGETKVILPGLPLQMDATSLRVSGSSTTPVSLGSVQLAEQLSSEAVQAKEHQLEEEIRRWQEKRQEVADAKTRAGQQLAFIRATGMQQPNKDTPAQGTTALPLTQWQQAWQTLETATAEAQTKVRTADKTLQEFDRGLAQLQAQLEQIATGETSNRTASLYVKAAQASNLTLSLSYQIPAAHWSPVYEAELDSSTGKLQFKTQAAIQQNTGEDWSNVKVNLSTLRPTASASLPELNSWVISLYEQPVVSEAAADTLRMAAANEAMPAPQAAPMPTTLAKERPAMKMLEENSALVNSRYNVEYQVPGALTLTSGSDTRRVTLESQTLDAKLQLSSAPRLDPRAILTTEAAYQGQAPLIPGTVALYRDGNFIGNSQLAELKTGELMKLAFGEDDRVKIRFQPIPEKTTQPGLLSSRKRLDYSYQVTIQNEHTEARSVKMYDMLPVPNNSDISVTPTGDIPSAKDVDNKKGVNTWVRELAAGAKVELNYGYSISYPQDQSLSGL